MLVSQQVLQQLDVWRKLTTTKAFVFEEYIELEMSSK